jgi:hypothetical protein
VCFGLEEMRLSYFVKRSFSEIPKRNIEIARKLDVILIRHAESTNNILHSYPQPDPSWRSKREADCGISQKGSQQLNHLSEFVRNGQWDSLLPSQAMYFCSPMKRCLQTMNAITSSLQTTPEVLVRPNMYEFGGCYNMEEEKVITQTGMNKSQVESLYDGFHCPPGLPNLTNLL